MANLTIRKLDDAIHAELRLRAARNGRSVEDEVRVILREACAAPRPGALPGGSPGHGRTLANIHAEAAIRLPRVTLIIGGGIAAFKSLDLIRRLKERKIEVRCVLTKAAQQFVTPLSASALSHERVYTDLFDPDSEFDAGHIRLGARLRSDRGGARHRRPDGEDGEWPRRRSRQRHPACGEQADPAGAGDEPADVEQRRDPPQCGAAAPRRHCI